MLLRNQNGQIEISPAGIDIHVANPDKAGSKVQLVEDVEEQDDGHAHELEEEVPSDLAGGHGLPSDGEGADPELGNEDEDIEAEANVGADDADLGVVRHFAEAAAAGGPGAAEADVAEANGRPCEDGGEAGDGEQPVEHARLLPEVGQEGKEAEEGGDEDGDEGPAASVDVAEDSGGLLEVGEGSEGSRGAKDGRVADGQDGDEDDGVHD